MKFELFALLLLVSTSLCITTSIVGPPEQYVITITSQYGTEKLTFTHNIYDSFKTPVYPNTKTLKAMIENSSEIDIVFKDSEDNGCSSVAIFNIVYKVRRYYNYQGVKKDFKSIEILDAPFDKTTIVLLGPRSGAQADQITIAENKIYVEGKSMEGNVCTGLEKAADKLILTAMGVELT